MFRFFRFTHKPNQAVKQLKKCSCIRPGIESLEDRLTPSGGSLDPTFGIGGKVIADYQGPATDEVQVIARMADGGIIVAGRSTDASVNALGPRLAVARFLPNGQLDTSFGTGGQAILRLERPVEIRAAAVQTDGTIILAGQINLSTGVNFLAIRMTSSGALDTSFGNAGLATASFDDNWYYGQDVAIQTDGKVVMSGYSLNSSHMAVARFDTNGQLDPTFDSDGQVILSQGYWNATVALQLDGKILVGGSDFSRAGKVFRLNTNGSLDTTFGTGGSIAVPNMRQGVRSLTVQVDGKVVIGGAQPAGSFLDQEVDFRIVRVNTNGSLDDGSANDSTPGDAFGTGGGVTTGFAVPPGYFGYRSDDSIRKIGLTLDGKIVALGTQKVAFPGSNSVQYHLAMARYNPNGTLDTTFDGDGVARLDNAAPEDGVIIPDGRLLVAHAPKYGVYQLSDPTAPGFQVYQFTNTGSLDSSFGNGGLATTRFLGSTHDTASKIAMQADGKMVVAGTMAGNGLLTRFHSNGSLDTTFGASGVVAIPPQFNLGGSYFTISSLMVQTDDKILLGGTWWYSSPSQLAVMAVMRFNSNGSQDATFDGDGIAVLDYPDTYADVGGSIALQADGKILVRGQLDWYFGNTAVTRLQSNGTVDSSFGTNGWSTLNGSGDLTQIAVSPTGKIAVGGSIYGTSDYDMGVYLLNSNGSIDTSFGVNGMATVDFGGSDIATSMLFQPDGKLILGGTNGEYYTSSFALARFTSSGTLDRSFGRGDGKVTTKFGDYYSSQLAKIALDSSGRIVAGGTNIYYPSDFALARYKQNGSLDPTFGDMGLVLTDFGRSEPYYESLTDIAIQQDDKIVATGYTYRDDSGTDIALARYQASQGQGSAPNYFSSSLGKDLDLILALINWDNESRSKEK